MINRRSPVLPRRLHVFLLAILLLGGASRIAFALCCELPQCLKDPSTGKWVIPQGAEKCTTRPPTSQNSAPTGPVAPSWATGSMVPLQYPEIRGEVYVSIGDGTPISADDIATYGLPLGAKIVTGPTGSFRAAGPGGHRFDVGGGAELIIDEVIAEPSNLKYVSVNLVHGYFRWVTGESGSYGDDFDALPYKVRSPGGTLAFAGGDTELNFPPGEEGTIKMRAGQAVFAPYDSDQKIPVKINQMLKFDDNGNFDGLQTFDGGSF